MSNRKFAESDWISTSFIEEPFPPPKVVEKTTMLDSAWELQRGCTAEELDTIPAELLDLFK